MSRSVLTKNFFKKITIFLLPVIALLIYVEYALYKIPNSYNQKRKYLESRLKNIEVITLGSSHTLYAVNPAYLSVPAFNLANVSQSLYYDKRLTLKYIDSMPRLKLVIIDIAYFSLYYQLRQAKDENWRDFIYYRDWGITYKDLPLFDMKRCSYIALYTPIFVREYASHLFKVNLADSLLSNGYDIPLPKSSMSYITDSFARTRIKSWNEIIDTNKYNYIFNDLKNFVSDLKKKNISVVFISCPVMPAVSRNYNSEIAEKNRTAIDELCIEYGCKYYDYTDDKRMALRDFNDVDHLNSIGAEHFSKIIDSEVVRTYFK